MKELQMFKRVLFFLLLSFTVTAVISAQFGFTVIPDAPRPGDPVTVAVTSGGREALLIVNDRQIARAQFFTVPAEGNNPGFRAAIFAVPSTADPGNAVIRIISESGLPLDVPITIAHREFRTETLNLNPTLTSLVADPNPQRTIESDRLWAILTTTGDQIYHTGQFVLPVTSTRRTSQFGTRRVNVYSDGRRVTSIHAGVDFGVPTGTEVFASGRGRVVLSRMRILTGYSVIIEHAPGVYSLYYHLDRVIAREGAIVETGQLIGLSGSTGFSTGPHLHWEVRVSTENTDPDILVSRPLLDKDLIISRIFQ
jgi:murein DD-endopeptidase MepM/ murein hydrolase activator NlpD